MRERESGGVKRKKEVELKRKKLGWREEVWLKGNGGIIGKK